MQLPLRTIDDHAGELCNLIVYGFDYLVNNNKWYQPISHLGMAAGIKSIEFDRVRFNSSFGWCSDADESSLDQNELETKLILSLCRFNFIWSALETIIDIVVPPKLIKEPRGKINNACFFLKQNTPPELSFKEYEITLNNLINITKNSTDYGNIISKNINGFDHVSNSGMGIYLSYKLRNSLVHGSLVIPESLRDEEDHHNKYLVDLCSRLVLYTIQMFTLIFWKDKFPIIEWEMEEIDIFTIFTHIQYEGDIFEMPKQFNLFNQ